MVSTSTQKSTSKDKFILKSKTIIGALIAMAPAIAVLFGVTFTEDDSALVSNAGDALIQVLGAAYAIYGRIVAEGNVRV